MRGGLPIVLAVAALAAGWSVAGYFLWDTRVPDDLRLPALRAGDYFTVRELARAADYERFHYVNWALSTVALLGVFVVYAGRGTRFMRESAAGPIGTGMLLAMLGFALAWLVRLPFSIAGLWWDRRHGVANYGYLELVFGGWLELGGQFVFLCLAMLIVMGLARLVGQWWWIPGAAVFVALGILFTLIAPYLVTDAHPLRDRKLVAVVHRLARAQGVEDVEVRVEDVDAYTSQANAYATGLGPSRTVFLWNTLLDGRFGDREVGVVIAHELAHHSRNHLWKGIGWYALFAVPGAFLIAAATRSRGGMGRPEAVPLSLLVLVVLNLAATPLQNVISRHLEAEADWVALETTRDPVAAQGLFERFAETGLSDPSPPGWAQVWLGTHPTLLSRMEMAEAWKERRR